MRASNIMTSRVITVGPQTPVQDIAALMFKARISAVPVLEEGRLVGLVSEGDLLRRHELGTDQAARAGSWWLRLFSDDRSPAQYVKSHAMKARDIMTRDVVTVTPYTSAVEIASLLEARRIKRVPVLRGSQLVGIVSRADLIQALAVSPHPRKRTIPSNDDAIRGRLLAELEHQAW